MKAPDQGDLAPSRVREAFEEKWRLGVTSNAQHRDY